MSSPVPVVLKELHRLRRHLRELQSEIDLGPRVMKIQQQKLADEEAAHKEAYETIKRLKVKLKEDEISLKQTEDNLSKFETQIHSAGSKKEYDAKTNEIAMAKVKRGEFEDAILNGMNEIEQRTADLPNVEAKWAAAKKDFEQYKVDAKDRLERMLADQKETQAAVAVAEAKLPAEMKGQYDRLIKSYGADGLAGVNGRSCGQCRTSITEQQRNALLGNSFLTCSQCGRGLYLAEGGA